MITDMCTNIEPAREVMLEYGMIPALVPLLSSTDKELSLQCIRALGNLCYEQGIHTG